MLLCVPDSWLRATEILGGKVVDAVNNIDPIIPEEIKVVDAEVVKETTKEEPVDVESTAELKPVESEDKITMESRKTCPVKITPTKKETYKVKVGESLSTEESLDESLESFKAKLVEKNVKIQSLGRNPNTGLIEAVLVNKYYQSVPITADNDDILFGLGCDVFFFGKINPLDEYQKQPILLTDESLNAILNGVQVDPKYYVPKSVTTLASVIDTGSVHEHNVEKKKEVLDVAFKAILKMEQDIKNVLGDEPYRFSFVKYKNKDEFTIVSSRKNRVSNLSKQKLLTTKTITIEVHDGRADMNIK